MRLNERYYFTGDRYADAILTQLLDYLEKEKNIHINEFEKGAFAKWYDEANLEKFVELVYDEFPLTMDTPNVDYDVEWSWNEFLDSKEGKQAKEWLENYSPVYENGLFLEILDKETIAETMDFITKPVEEFCKNNPIGKKLSKKDKDCIIETIREAEIGEFENGYTWGADEFTNIEMTDHDGEHNYSDVRNEMDKYMKYAKDGKLLATWYTDWFDDTEVFVLYSIDLEELAKNAL